MAAFTCNRRVKTETIWLTTPKTHALTNYMALYRRNLPVFSLINYCIPGLAGKKWYHFKYGCTEVLIASPSLCLKLFENSSGIPAVEEVNIKAFKVIIFFTFAYSVQSIWNTLPPTKQK